MFSIEYDNLMFLQRIKKAYCKKQKNPNSNSLYVILKGLDKEILKKHSFDSKEVSKNELFYLSRFIELYKVKNKDNIEKVNKDTFYKKRKKFIRTFKRSKYTNLLVTKVYNEFLSLLKTIPHKQGKDSYSIGVEYKSERHTSICENNYKFKDLEKKDKPNIKKKEIEELLEVAIKSFLFIDLIENTNNRDCYKSINLYDLYNELGDNAFIQYYSFIYYWYEIECMKSIFFEDITLFVAYDEGGMKHKKEVKLIDIIMKM